jgi:hypothetical protein
VIAATFVHNRWAAMLALPALCFPGIVMADTARWLKPIVEGLAAAAGATVPWPSVPWWGRLALNGTVLQIHPGTGLALAGIASLVVAAGLWLHRRAYKPVALAS